MNSSSIVIVVGGAFGLLAIGLYGLLITRHLLKIIVALQIITKSVLLALIAAGHVSGRIQLAQSLAVTVIVADTITAVIALALAIRVQQKFGTLDLKELARLKG